jgi:hypothetical protein
MPVLVGRGGEAALAVLRAAAQALLLVEGHVLRDQTIVERDVVAARAAQRDDAPIVEHHHRRLRHDNEKPARRRFPGHRRKPDPFRLRHTAAEAEAAGDAPAALARDRLAIGGRDAGAIRHAVGPDLAETWLGKKRGDEAGAVVHHHYVPGGGDVDLGDRGEPLHDGDRRDAKAASLDRHAHAQKASVLQSGKSAG